MRMMTKKHMNEFARLGRQDDKGKDALVVARLHIPLLGFEWYLTELNTDPKSDSYGIGFGYANLNDPVNSEYGYVDLHELAAASYNFRNRKIDEWEPLKLADRRIAVRLDEDFPVSKVKIGDIVNEIEKRA